MSVSVSKRRRRRAEPCWWLTLTPNCQFPNGAKILCLLGHNGAETVVIPRLNLFDVDSRSFSLALSRQELSSPFRGLPICSYSCLSACAPFIFGASQCFKRLCYTAHRPCCRLGSLAPGRNFVSTGHASEYYPGFASRDISHPAL